MEYLTGEKDIKYHLKSAANTFAAVFFSVLLFLLAPYHGLINGLQPGDITLAAILAGLSVFVRIVIIAALMALFDVVVIKYGTKFKKDKPNS